MKEFLGYILKLKFLSGFRTYIAAFGMLGLSMYSFSEGRLDAGMTQLLMALGALGLYEQSATPVVITPPNVPVVPPSPPPAPHPAPVVNDILVDALVAAIEARLKK